jgi:hypothetical protein
MLTSPDRLREARRLRGHVQPPLRQQRLGQDQEQAHGEPTPKKVPAGRKKAAAKDDAEDGDASPTKKATPRKRAAKKQDVDGDASPKKKGRAKKGSDDDGEYLSFVTLLWRDLTDRSQGQERI